MFLSTFVVEICGLFYAEEGSTLRRPLRMRSEEVLG
jgi:hypothetical protein